MHENPAGRPQFTIAGLALGGIDTNQKVGLILCDEGSITSIQSHAG